MKACSVIIVSAAFMAFSHLAGATQADDTTIRITGHAAGATPFISKLTLEVSNTTVLKSIQFKITPKPGSVTRPLSGTYANLYLMIEALKTRKPARSFCRSMAFTMDTITPLRSRIGSWTAPRREHHQNHGRRLQ